MVTIFAIPCRKNFYSLFLLIVLTYVRDYYSRFSRSVGTGAVMLNLNWPRCDFHWAERVTIFGDCQRQKRFLRGCCVAESKMGKRRQVNMYSMRVDFSVVVPKIWYIERRPYSISEMGFVPPWNMMFSFRSTCLSKVWHSSLLFANSNESSLI